MGASQLPRRTAMVRRVLDVLPQEIALVAGDGTIVWVNAAWRDFAADNSGPVSAAVGWNYLDVCRRAVDSGEPVARSVLGALTSAVDGDDPGPGASWEYACHGPGVQRWFQVTVRPMADPTGPLRSAGAVVLHEDITARIQAQRAYRRQVFEDPMTGLANELLFNDRAARAIAAAPRHGRRVGVVLLDVPGAELASEASRPAVRRLLRAVGQRLRAEVRLQDLVARWSGGTFVVLAEDVIDLADLVVVAQRLVAAIVQELSGGEVGDAPVPVATGLATNRRGDTPQELLIRAENSLSRSRARGGVGFMHAGTPLGALEWLELVDGDEELAPAVGGVVDLRTAGDRADRRSR